MFESVGGDLTRLGRNFEVFERFEQMFPSGTDSVVENSGVSGAVLIPTRFVWPYGGRRVFVTGSFTRLVLDLIQSVFFSFIISIFRFFCVP